jgi:hypothetical protein
VATADCAELLEAGRLRRGAWGYGAPFRHGDPARDQVALCVATLEVVADRMWRRFFHEAIDAGVDGPANAERARSLMGWSVDPTAPGESFADWVARGGSAPALADTWVRGVYAAFAAACAPAAGAATGGILGRLAERVAAVDACADAAARDPRASTARVGWSYAATGDAVRRALHRAANPRGGREG